MKVYMFSEHNELKYLSRGCKKVLRIYTNCKHLNVENLISLTSVWGTCLCVERGTLRIQLKLKITIKLPKLQENDIK